MPVFEVRQQVGDLVFLDDVLNVNKRVHLNPWRPTRLVTVRPLVIDDSRHLTQSLPSSVVDWRRYVDFGYRITTTSASCHARCCFSDSWNRDHVIVRRWSDVHLYPLGVVTYLQLLAPTTIIPSPARNVAARYRATPGSTDL